MAAIDKEAFLAGHHERERLHSSALRQMEDRVVVERALPSYMMVLAMQSVQAAHEGLLREDYVTLLNRESIADVSRLDPHRMDPILKQIEKIGFDILKEGCNDIRRTLYAASCLMIELHKAGRLPDPNTAAVLTAADIIQEVADEPEDWGGRMSPDEIRGAVRRMTQRAELIGLFPRPA